MLGRRLTDPRVILLATVLGGLLGAYAPGAGRALAPYGQLYVAVLSICIMPIMMTALISGTGQLLRKPSLRRTFPRFAAVYLATLLVPCTVALAIGLVLEPGANLSPEAVANLGKELSPTSASLEPKGLASFLLDIIPANIFRDLATQNFVAIVIFSILLGIGLGLVDAPASDDTLRIVQALFAAFTRIFEWILVALPLGLFCLTAGITATVNVAMFLSLISFIAAFYSAGLAVLVIYTVILVLFRRVDHFGSLFGLRRPLTISFLANNPFIALRPAIHSLVERFNVEDEVANTVVPFGIIAAQHGQIINIILLTIFLGNIYGVDLSALQIVTLAIGAVIAGTAFVGGGPALALVLVPILASIGVPGDLAIVVLVTTEQIVGPLISLLTVYAASTLVLLGGTKSVSRTMAKTPEVREKVEP